MADKEEKKKEEEVKNEEKDTKAQEKETSPQDGGKLSILALIIMITVVITLSGSGFILGRLFAGPSSPDTAEIPKEEAGKQDVPAENSESDPEGRWYYHLDPVVANLDVPGVTRYVRATITMEISSDWDKIEGELILEEKKFLLKNWLAIYLASLTIEDARGDRNLRRIQAQILDAFNKTLFPDSKPQIKRILFKEGFAVQ